MIIPFSKPDITEVEFEHVRKCLEGGDLSGDGTYTKKCEQFLSKMHQDKAVLLTHSCTGALEISMFLANIGPGDEVIIPDFTFVSTADAVVVRGAKPVFVDVCRETLNIDVNEIERAITSKTKAIIVVHYAGIGADMPAIMAIAQRHNLFVVEDAAQAIGSRYDKLPLGAIGHSGALSFHNTKNITSGEGGALILGDQRLIDRAHIIREKGTNRRQFISGQVDKYTWVDVGSSYVVSDVSAALLYGQLQRFDEISKRRNSVFDAIVSVVYPKLLRHDYRLPNVPKEATHNAHIIWALAPSKAERDRALAFLRSKGIQATFHFQSLSLSPAGKTYGSTPNPVPVSISASETLLRIPISSTFSEAQLQYLVEGCLECWSK